MTKDEKEIKRKLRILKHTEDMRFRLSSIGMWKISVFGICISKQEPHN